MPTHDHSGIGGDEGISDGTRVRRGFGRAVATVDDGYVAVVMVSAATGLAVLLRGWRRRRASALVVSGTIGPPAIPVLLWADTRFHVPLAPHAAVAGARLVARP